MCAFSRSSSSSTADGSANVGFQSGRCLSHSYYLCHRYFGFRVNSPGNWICARRVKTVVESRDRTRPSNGVIFSSHVYNIAHRCAHCTRSFLDTTEIPKDSTMIQQQFFVFEEQISNNCLNTLCTVLLYRHNFFLTTIKGSLKSCSASYLSFLCLLDKTAKPGPGPDPGQPQTVVSRHIMKQDLSHFSQLNDKCVRLCYRANLHHCFMGAIDHLE